MGKRTIRFDGTTVLVVEDNMINQIVTKDNLENLGCFVDAAASGKEAIALAAKQDYDFIIMDVQMPDMDGYEATMHIREKQTLGHPPIIIALTANALPEDRDKCLNAGMDDYIAKPIQPDTLRKMLEKHLVQD